MSASQQSQQAAERAGAAGGAPAAAQWSARSVGASWQHRFFYLLIRYLGLAPAYQWVHIIVAWYCLFSPAARRKTRCYLDRRFPERRRPWQRFADSYRLLVALGLSLVDRAAFGIRGAAAVQVEFVDKQALADLAAEGRGIVVVNSHVGCWQIAVSAFEGLGLPVNIVMQRDAGDVDRHYFEHSGGKPPFEIIDPTGPMGNIVAMLGALERKEVLGLMADRVFGSMESTVAAPFLGGRVEFPFSPYRFASASGAPIAVIFSHRAGRGRWDVRLVKVIRVPPGLGRKPAAYAPWAAEFAAALEQYTREHPWEFFNFYDMWNR